DDLVGLLGFLQRADVLVFVHHWCWRLARHTAPVARLLCSITVRGVKQRLGEVDAIVVVSGTSTKATTATASTGCTCAIEPHDTEPNLLALADTGGDVHRPGSIECQLPHVVLVVEQYVLAVA